MQSIKDNTSREFEGLAKCLFQGMLEQDSVKTLEILHDVAMKGKTTAHQIDVFWRFESGNIEYATVVQCKNWSRRVSKGEILKFKGVLDDLPHQPRGIFVARSGYQRGAVEFAEASGIELYDLRPPLAIDVEPIARWQGIDVSKPQVKFGKAEFVFDEDWRRREKNRMRIPDGQDLGIRETRKATELVLYTEGDAPIETVADILGTIVGCILNNGIAGLLAKKGCELPLTMPLDIPFSEPTFLHTCNPAFPRVKVNGIRGNITLTPLLDLIHDLVMNHVSFVLRRLTNLKPGDNWRAVCLDKQFSI